VSGVEPIELSSGLGFGNARRIPSGTPLKFWVIVREMMAKCQKVSDFFTIIVPSPALIQRLFLPEDSAHKARLALDDAA
jgi:hypothetical protein